MCKICNKCNLELEFTYYGLDKRSKDGYKGTCKPCLRNRAKLYRAENREEINKRSNKHYHDNKDKRKQWEIDNIDILREKKRIYYILNKEIIKNKRNDINVKEKRNYKRRLNNDPMYRMKNSIRTSIGRSIRSNGYTKKSKTNEILGCSFEEFKLYLESKFEDWMNWDNYGLYNGEFGYGWDIDHIIPLSTSTSEDDILELNKFVNLQPLCSKVNRDIKKDNY